MIFEALFLFVDTIRRDAEVEGYFGMFLNLTWPELREIDRENGIASVYYERDGHTEAGLAFIGAYPGTSLDEVRESLH